MWRKTGKWSILQTDASNVIRPSLEKLLDCVFFCSNALSQSRDKYMWQQCGTQKKVVCINSWLGSWIDQRTRYETWTAYITASFRQMSPENTNPWGRDMPNSHLRNSSSNWESILNAASGSASSSRFNERWQRVKVNTSVNSKQWLSILHTHKHTHSRTLLYNLTNTRTLPNSGSAAVFTVLTRNAVYFDSWVTDGTLHAFRFQQWESVWKPGQFRSVRDFLCRSVRLFD